MDKKGHFIKRTYAPKCLCTKLTHFKNTSSKTNKLQGEIDKFTITDRKFNTPLSITDRTNRQKIRKDTLELNNTITHLT